MSQRILFFFVAFFTLSIAQAQIIEAGLNIGASFNTKPDINAQTSPPACLECEKVFSPTISGRFMYNAYEHFQIGLGVDVQYLRNTSTIKTPSGQAQSFEVRYANPMVPIYVLGNYRVGKKPVGGAYFGRRATYFYVGGMLGYVYSSAPRVNGYAWNRENPTYYTSDGSGAVGGFQMGGSVRVSPRLTVTIEAAARYNILRLDSQVIYPKKYTLKDWVFPFTVGFRYRGYQQRYPLVDRW